MINVKSAVIRVEREHDSEWSDVRVRGDMCEWARKPGIAK